jgi:hypothetical protein
MCRQMDARNILNFCILKIITLRFFSTDSYLFLVLIILLAFTV